MNEIYGSSFLMSEKDIKTAETYKRIKHQITQKILQVNLSKDQLYYSSIPDLRKEELKLDGRGWGV